VFENNIKSKYKPKGYKLQIAQTVFERLNWTKADDKDFLNNAIAFLHSSGRIKKISFVKRMLALGKRFLHVNFKHETNINIQTIIDNVPTVINYRSSMINSLIAFKENVLQRYVPRIITKLTKYNLLQMILMKLGINQNWILLLLLAIL
jgi:hypothetical protein